MVDENETCVEAIGICATMNRSSWSVNRGVCSGWSATLAVRLLKVCLPPWVFAPSEIKLWGNAFARRIRLPASGPCRDHLALTLRLESSRYQRAPPTHGPKAEIFKGLVDERIAP